jgi:probable F420-dependent oxidoreductase
MDQGYDPRMIEPENLIRFAQTAEQYGFDGIAFTEHPAPSQKWMATGGHDSFDPLTALAFVAGATKTLKLQTFLLVVPYRNPFLAAKQVTTLDIVSGGRLILNVGSGYLRSEFLALGVEFEERNALFDEALEVMQGIWTTDDFKYEGRHFKAIGQTQHPRPAQAGGPPIWFGGNSKLARRRTAKIGSGWSPMINEAQLATTTRTPVISSPAELASAVTELRELTEAEGRDPNAIAVQAEWPHAHDMTRSPEQTLDVIGQLTEAGATYVIVEPDRTNFDKAIAELEAYGEQVVAKTS